MNLRQTVIVFGVLYSSHVSAQLPAIEAWETADERTVRIDPGKIQGLPAEIRTDLLLRGCTIPQWYRADETKGIIKGSFFSSDSSDLAVLCSIDRISTILVYKDSSTSDIHEINQAPDERYIQSIGEGQYGFSRLIGVVTPNEIQAYYEFFDGPEPPTLTHDGLEDIYAGKASSILYWHQGQWIGLQGND